MVIAAAARAGGVYAMESAPTATTTNYLVTAFLAIVAAGWTVVGFRLPNRRTSPGLLPLAGALLVVHLLTLWFAWYYQPLGSASFADDPSGLLDSRPSWHAPALASFIALAAAWPTTALLLLLAGRGWPDGRTVTQAGWSPSTCQAQRRRRLGRHPDGVVHARGFV